MRTFICSISRLSGVPTTRLITNAMNVSMLTIGRTSDANPNSTPTTKTSAPIGKLKISSQSSQMDATASIIANTHTDGRSKNIIHTILKLIPVVKGLRVTNSTVRTGMTNLTKDNPQE